MPRLWLVAPERRLGHEAIAPGPAAAVQVDETIRKVGDATDPLRAAAASASADIGAVIQASAVLPEVAIAIEPFAPIGDDLDYEVLGEVDFKELRFVAGR